MRPLSVFASLERTRQVARIVLGVAVAVQLWPVTAVGQTTDVTWLWDVAGNRSGWTPNNYSADVVSGSIWTINPNHDMYIVSPLLTRAPSSVNYLRVGIKNKGLNEEGQFFYYAPGLPPNESRSRWFTTPSIALADRYNWITVRLDDISGWSSASNIDRIRIDPVRTDVPLNGNDDILIDFVFLRLDGTNPNQPTITSWSPTGWTNGTFTVSFSSNDPPPIGFPNPVGPDVYGAGINDFRYRVENVPDAVKYPDSFDDRSGLASATVTVSAVQQGANVFHVYCFDRVGRVSVENTVTLYFDSTPPGTPAVTGVNPSGWTSTNSFMFSWSNPGDAHSGLNRYQWRVDGGSASDVASTFVTIGAPSAGQHDFQVRAIDNVGNIGAWSAVARFYYDPLAPGTPTVTNVDPSAWTNTNGFNFSWTNPGDAHSGVGSYQWRVDGGAVTTSTGPSVTDVQSPSVGTHIFEVRAIDNAGNSGTWSASVSFYFDDVAPSAPGTPAADPPGYTNVNAYTMAWDPSSDAHSGVAGYEYRVNGGAPVLTSSAMVSGPLATDEGANLFELRSMDVAGNSSNWVSTDFYFDSTAPAAPVLSADPAGCSSANSFSVTWDAVVDPQGIARYEYRLGGEGGAIAWTSELHVSGIAATQECGEDFAVRAVDGVGNTGSWAQLSLCWDGTPPGTPASQVTPSTWTQTNSFSVTWSAVTDACTGLESYCARVGANGDSTCMAGTSISGPLARFEGVDTVYVYSRDAVGNQSPGSTVLLRYDATPPSASIDSLPPVTTTTSFVLRWSGLDSGSGVASHDVQFKDALTQNWSDWLIATTADSAAFGAGDPIHLLDTHRYQFRIRRVTDMAGNGSTYGGPAQAMTTVHFATSDQEESDAIMSVALRSGFPNPFADRVSIVFELPQTTQVRIRIYSIDGRIVDTLAEGEVAAGRHSVLWNGRDGQGRLLASGLYFCKLDTPIATHIKKLVLRK